MILNNTYQRPMKMFFHIRSIDLDVCYSNFIWWKHIRF